MNIVTVDCWGAQLKVVEDLAKIWPNKLPLSYWPTFCGAGDGLGDKIVPDQFRGVYANPACIAHDIEWSLSPSRNPIYFVTGNYNFWLNLRSLVHVQLKEGTRQYKMAMHLCNLYAFAVTSPIGWRCFNPTGVVDFDLNEDVQSKIARLDSVCRNHGLEILA